jgi:HSP20 family protein
MSNFLANYLDDWDDEFFFRPLSIQNRHMLSTIPALNMEEFDDHYEVKLTSAGLDPKKIHVELVGNTLSFSYKHEIEDQEVKKGILIRHEFSYHSFNRTISLPKNTDENSIKAESSKGILTVKINKMPEEKPKEIDIEIVE